MVEAPASQEKAYRAIMDAACLAEELRAEQDHAKVLERERRSLGLQMKDMQV